MKCCCADDFECSQGLQGPAKEHYLPMVAVRRGSNEAMDVSEDEGAAMLSNSLCPGSIWSLPRVVSHCGIMYVVQGCSDLPTAAALPNEGAEQAGYAQ